jgi:predicted nucleic acid-binding protein
MRIFLDANILFSASKSDGAVRELLSMLIELRHELWADGYVVEEARRNLALKAPDSIPALETLLKEINLAPVRARLDSKLPLPEKDKPVLAAAVESRCDVLVTGDRAHFGRFYGTTISRVEVLSPAMLAEKISR